jgi:alkylhydroperoxidase family enzyme
MARIPYPRPEELNEKLRASMQTMPQINILRMLQHAQGNFLPFISFASSVLLDQELDGKLRELAILRVAHLTGANYEWTQHVPIAIKAGATEAQVAAIPKDIESKVFSELEKKVLRFTSELTQNVRVSDATFKALAAELPPRQLVELSIAAGLYGAVARVMEAFQVELEPTAGTYTVDIWKDVKR